MSLIFYAVSSLITAILSLSLGILVYSRNKSNPINRNWLVMSICVAIWTIGFSIMVSGIFSHQLALFFDRISHVGALFIPLFYLKFVVSIFGERSGRRWDIFFLTLISLLLVPTIFSRYFIVDVVSKYHFRYYPIGGVFYVIFSVYFFLVVAYAQYLLLIKIFNSKGYQKNQLLYIFIAACFGFLGGATTFPLVYGVNIPPIGGPLVFIYTIVITYAILKYHLLDINIALTRAGIFALVYFFVGVIPFWLAPRFLGTSFWWIPILLMGLLATSGPLIYNYLRKKAEDVILREQHRYQSILHNLSKGMIRIKDLDALLKTVTLTMVDIVKTGFAAIYLKEDEYKSYQLKRFYPQAAKERFKEFISLDHPLISSLLAKKGPLSGEEASQQKEVILDSGIITPYFIEDTLLGFLVLGAKPKAQMYTTDDILALETISYSTSLAIENCRFWQEVENRQRKARLQEMDTYSYSLAHEIDNPMQVILGQAGALKQDVLKQISDGDKTKDISESFDFILEAADRVSKMVRAIRDFGSKTTGELKPLKIQDVAESFSKLYLPQFKSNSVYFEKSLPEKAIYVRGEKPELMQVLVILANNAIHACLGTKEKEKRITLTVALSNHDKVRVAMKDNGYGIKKELMPIIFASFTTTKASTEGTGMGLYNATNIIQKHKGKIWAESEGEGKGSVFFIELPIAQDVREEDFKKEEKGKRLF